MIGKNELENLRKVRAFALLAKGDTPIMIDDETFHVPSQSDREKKYTVTHTDVWTCSCPDFQKIGVRCKHIQSVEMWLKIRESIEVNIEELREEMDNNKIVCEQCKSPHIVRNGSRKIKQGIRQTYKCKDCGYRFSVNRLKNYKVNTKLVALSLDLYFKGLSYRKIANTIYQFYEIKVDHTTIIKWVNKFMNKINEYVSKYNPNLGETWNIDEQMVKSEGDWVYSWNVLDEKTRFLIANTVTKERSLLETEKVFHKAIGSIEGKPRMVVTDKMNAYPYAVKQNFPESVHIKAGIRSAINNNKLERFHGTWRERDKVMRGLQNDITTEEMLNNYRTYYNFIRPHSALNGKTPSEVAKIDLELGKNKWMGLIEKSL